MLQNGLVSRIPVEEVAQRNLDLLRLDLKTSFQRALIENTISMHIDGPSVGTVYIRSDSSGLILEVADRDEKLPPREGSVVFEMRVETAGGSFDMDSKMRFQHLGSVLGLGRRARSVCDEMNNVQKGT